MEGEILIRKIVITGPESTGKSTLCRQLAEHYGTSWVPEFARTYLEAKGSTYEQADLLKIARGQLATEDEIASRVKATASHLPLFIDTDLHVIRIWSEYVFGDCDTAILKEIAVRHYDLYLLCDTDLPWNPDPLREYPDLEERRRIFCYYLDYLSNQPTPWAMISGREEDRLRSAILAVDQFMLQNRPL